MVPYDQLLPIEQMIVEWKIAHPELMALIDAILLMIVGAIIAVALVEYFKQRKIEQERHRAERARKRAWIKSRGGL